MKRATPNQIRRLFPNASQSTIEANLDAGLQDSEPECPVQPKPLAAVQRKSKGPGRIILSYLSRRQRLLDPDNLAGGTKFLTDALRYCGCLRGDEEDKIDLRFRQEKVKEKAQEATVIEITFP